MFESLDDTMKADAKKATTNKERMVLWLAIAAASLLVFGGLFVGVRVFS
jgi:uncharacterized membrane protein